MIIQGLTVGELARETVLTLEGLGGKVLRTIKGNSQLVIQNAAWVEEGLRRQGGKNLKKNRVEMAWRKRIEALTDVIVARDRLDAEEGLSVIVSLTVVELALGLQKRRGVRAKDAEGP